MEGTLAPRGTAREATVGFHETGDGATLVLGRPRYLARVVGLAVGFLFVAGFSLYLSSLAAAEGNPSGAARTLYLVLVFLVFDSALIVAILLQSGRWSLAADGTGIHLVRTHRRTKDLDWSQVKKIQYGPTAVRAGRYGVGLGDAIRIDAARAIAPILLDTVRFRIGADDMDRMAAILKDLGVRHGVAVELFPMAGREVR